MVVKKTLMFSFLFCLYAFYSNATYVEVGSDLFPQEIDYLKKRRDIVKAGMYLLTETEMKIPPIVGLCFSGGGYRALISSTGFLCAAQEMGLLSAASYFGGVSGSTWTILSLLAKSRDTPKYQLSAFREDIKDRVGVGFWDIFTFDWKAIIKNFYTKIKGYGGLTPSDIWGAFLLDRLIGTTENPGQDLLLSDLIEGMEKYLQFPYPVFEVDIKNQKLVQEFLELYERFEIAAYATGSLFLNGFIDTIYFGNYFENGDLDVDEQKPELSLAFYMGLLGSAYDANGADIVWNSCAKLLKKKFLGHTLRSYFDAFVKKVKCMRKSFLPTKVDNPTHDMQESPFPNARLDLADGGYSLNLPLVALLRKNRQVKVIVCCDDSSDACAKGFPELVRAQTYAQEYGLEFPSLQYPWSTSKYGSLVAKYCRVFKCDDSGKPNRDIPTIIYFANPIKDSTIKMKYSAEEFDDLCDMMYALTWQGKDLIAEEVVARAVI